MKLWNNFRYLLLGTLLILLTTCVSYKSFRRELVDPTEVLDSIALVHKIQLPDTAYWIHTIYRMEYIGDWNEWLYYNESESGTLIITLGKFPLDSVYELKYRVE